MGLLILLFYATYNSFLFCLFDYLFWDFGAELKELVSLHCEDVAGPLTRDEVSIMRAVLELRDKNVTDVMMALENVFMLPFEGKLDNDLLQKVNTQSTHSKIIHSLTLPDNTIQPLPNPHLPRHPIKYNRPRPRKPTINIHPNRRNPSLQHQTPTSSTCISIDSPI